jgi:hypothetical protein
MAHGDAILVPPSLHIRRMDLQQNGPHLPRRQLLHLPPLTPLCPFSTLQTLEKRDVWTQWLIFLPYTLSQYSGHCIERSAEA